MKFLKRVVEDNDTMHGRAFDLVIEALIVFSLITFSLETLPNLSETAARSLWIAEVITIMVFTAEYMLRVVVADDKLRFVSSFFGIVDLLAILPFYIATGVDLRSARAFRLLRLVRIVKLARYNKAVRRLHSALLIAKEEIVLYLIVTAILLYLSAVGIYYFESQAQPEQYASVFHCLWWSVTTLTTVGYGDTYPITLGGRIFTFFVLLIGLGVVAMPAGLFASALSKARELEDEEA